mmetsp:Transcript_45401/g.126311  ORF Transcript_45401/g.126311 Transcript_45401/m.126311 type:complete len:165 (-) Transcript_45401:7-501(-)
MKTVDHAPPRLNRRHMVKGLAKSCTARAMACRPSVLTRAAEGPSARLLPNDARILAARPPAASGRSSARPPGKAEAGLLGVRRREAPCQHRPAVVDARMRRRLKARRAQCGQGRQGRAGRLGEPSLGGLAEEGQVDGLPRQQGREMAAPGGAVLRLRLRRVAGV